MFELFPLILNYSLQIKRTLSIFVTIRKIFGHFVIKISKFAETLSFFHRVIDFLPRFIEFLSLTFEFFSPPCLA